jgi:plasmid stabilization system protein ParE
VKPAKFSPRAQRDLERIRGIIAAENPDAAERVRNAILDSADPLSQNPEMGQQILNSSQRHAALRWFVVPPFRNYLSFYRPFQDSVLVVRILHAARDWTRFFKK